MYDVLQKVPQALYGCLLIVVGFYVSTTTTTYFAKNFPIRIFLRSKNFLNRRKFTLNSKLTFSCTIDR